MDSRRDEPETINVWELMSGLDDDDSSSPRPTPFPAIPPSKGTAALPATTLAAKLSMDSFTLEPGDVARPKPHWQPSHRVDGPLLQRNPIHELEDQAAHVPSTELNSAYTPPSRGSSLFGSVSGGSDMSPFENLAENLQRSLSFKLVFNRGERDVLGGLEDPLFSDSPKDEFFSGDLPSMAANRRASEGDSEARRPSESASFSASARLMRWIKANKRALKLHRAMTGASAAPAAQEAQQHQLKKPSPAPAARPPRTTKYTISAGKVSDGASTSTASVSGSSRKLSDGSSSGKGSDDFAELNGSTARAFGSSDRQRSSEGRAVRRYRHSYSNGNLNKAPPTGEIFGNPASMNRASSWEIEKVAVDAPGKAVLYSTNARADIDAYEDSNAVRAILMSIVGSSFDERSVSQNPDYEQDLKNALNLPTVAVPVVCVGGKCIAGIDDIMQSFKKGILGSLLLETLPRGSKPNAPCLCRGGKFLICPICKGKRTLAREGEAAVSCRHCIGTGLLKCPSCPKP